MKLIYCLLILLISRNLKQNRFDKQKWDEDEHGFNGERVKMLNDLFENNLKVGMTYNELVYY